MVYAVIRTGGKQYKVAPQDVLQIEKIEGAAGDSVNFAEVLALGGGEGEPKFGVPLVNGAAVSAEIVEQGKGPKIIIFKKRRRQNSRRRNGHRQFLTTVRIVDILTDGKAAPVKAAEAAPAEEAPKKAAKAKAAPAEGGEEAPKKPRAKKTDKAE
ncbi:50S ribosomal protein L21 [Rhodomicrobium sp. Az07]|uniref:50S ribosomal protein L21 n=1 Tax=Rhodomicrobium sp. Az07 TaxID=2839034 RepID=UPI001BEA4944|nr:50S ribosomal protein L21 [Rhodomicrobium sp. Az07]MBT3069666.1 50S ribosomal protein L21 [Rhodomicrobium sp. Az07]